MRFFSTRDPTRMVSAKEAVLSALSGEAGLFMPEQLPPLSSEMIRRFPQMGLAEIAYEVIKPFFEGEVPDLKAAVGEAFSFPLPVVGLFDDSYSVELFHGPSLAFKDFGARFMAQVMSRFVRGEPRTLTVLVATSGDTGGAVAAAFHNVPGTRVVILYPKGRVSELQEKQIASLGGNVHAMRIDGSFDDCQRLVKLMLADQEVTSKLFLTTANSINVCRLIPQAAYYFYAASRVPSPICCSVPSGNFGNLTAGFFAYRMGLPVKHFIAATNANRTVPDYLASGQYQPRPSLATISNAMDVGDPSNFRRMLSLFGGDHAMIRRICSGISVTDQETADAIREVFSHGATLDPHSAIAWLALSKNRCEGATPLFLSTAHPAKFKGTLDQILQTDIALPPELSSLKDRPALSVDLSPAKAQVRHHLLSLV